MAHLRDFLMGRGFSASLSDVDYDALIRQKQEGFGQFVAAAKKTNKKG
ncbi:MAG: hypothetical protein M3530_12225 [Thermoproteota archaeon]|nr:hypothetical protein [Thermoproteota archaeon]